MRGIRIIRRLEIGVAHHQTKKGRLGVTAARGTFSLGAAIVFQLEQGKLRASAAFQASSCW